MIQRIQSLWLFLAAMINGAVFISPLYKYHQQNGLFMVDHVDGVRNFYPLLIVAVVITLLPLVTIFMFNNRPRQRGMTILSILSCASFLMIMFMHASNIKKATPPVTDLQYLIPGTILPAIGMVPLILAIIGIRKDEKLIRSLDRLR